MLLLSLSLSCRLEEIGAAASKEYSLEKSLDKMKREWTELRLVLSPYKDTVKNTCYTNLQQGGFDSHGSDEV